MTPPLKQRFPFRLGTTSYIVPADILPNIDYLKEKVDDIEVLLFESDDFSNLPDESVLAAMAEQAAAHDLTYTIHMPLDAHLGDPDERVRQASVGKCQRIIELMRPLEPFGWIVHFAAKGRGLLPVPDTEAWRSRLKTSMETLLREGIAAERFCVEILGYPYELIEAVVADLELSTCFDVGHLWAREADVPYYIERYLPQSRVVHLHGVQGRKDHLDLSVLAPERLGGFMDALFADRTRERVVTMEVFSEDHFIRSAQTMEAWGQ